MCSLIFMEKLVVLPVLHMGFCYFSGNVLFTGEMKVTKENATMTSSSRYCFSLHFRSFLFFFFGRLKLGHREGQEI